ncbi:hypothetical protein D9619_000849 [Psilocybe cf. subviscida]|uniref:Uncharacterized protein n=1 Tax=Psilocybe cf. subviscida TaxID=2480587 RepID=A0A8H5BFE8_9AGAR|nr:hypothetical protein D9619_000849 [Psilocybe cf. subviscida]
MALPSFIELMASLGLEQRSSGSPSIERSPSPQPRSTPSSSPRSVGSLSLPTRSSSSPALKELIGRHRTSRYSPYYPGMCYTRRRDSISSNSSASDFESSPISPTFITAASCRTRRYRNKLSVNTYGSSSDLAADTPISTYVRRKTPGSSPTSPTFARDSGYESSSPDPMPFSIPSLPVLIPQSSSSDSFPNTPTDAEMAGSPYSSPAIRVQPLADITDGTNHHRFIRRHTGTRISNAPRGLHSSHISNHHSLRKQSFDLSA